MWYHFPIWAWQATSPGLTSNHEHHRITRFIPNHNHHYVPNGLIFLFSTFLYSLLSSRRNSGKSARMSDDTSKADTIAFHFYTKLFYTVNHARATEEARGPSKVDKWVRKKKVVLVVAYLHLHSSTSRHPTRTSLRGRQGSRIEASRRRRILARFLWRYKCCCRSRSSRTTRRWCTSLLTRRPESGSSPHRGSSCSKRGRWG